jgi:hypothetical protein
MRSDGAVGHVVGSGDVDQSLAGFAPCHVWWCVSFGFLPITIPRAFAR